MKRKVCLILVLFSLFFLSCGGGGGGGSSSPATTAPPAPENILSTSGNAQVRLSWENASGATTYNIYWSTTAGVVKKTGTKISAVTSPYYHSGLNNGTAYHYVVTAVNQYGESSESVEVSATPSLTNPPLPPTNIATMALDRQIVIRWTAVEAEDASTSHNIYWSTSSGVTKGNGTKIANTVSPYAHEGLTNGMTYYYVVTTVNQRGESIESEEASVAPDDRYAPPMAPTGVTATAGDRQAMISWHAVDNAASYNIYWSSSAVVSSKSGTKLAAVKNPYIHTELAQGTVYYYVVTAVNGYGESKDSDRVSAIIPDYRKDVCVALGDSITTGSFVNYAESYVPRLSAAWGKTIYNKGVAGTVSSYGANVIDSILAQYNPKYITIFYGTNDDGFYGVDWIIANLRYMIRSAKANGTKPVIATLTPVFGEWAWRKSSEIILNQRIRQLASEEGINCADLEAAFGWNANYINSDGLHPNSAGHQIIANTFYTALTH